MDILKKITGVILILVLCVFIYADNDYDFRLNVTPFVRTMDAGESTHYQVTVQFTGGYDTPVNLSVTGLPAGASGHFTVNPITRTGNGRTKLEIETLPETPCGTYPLTVTGEEDGGGIVHSVTVTLIIGNCLNPDFSIEAGPLNRDLYPGESVNFNIKLTSIDGFSKPVKLFVEGLPNGAAGDFRPGHVRPTGESTLTITTSETTPVGTYTLTVAGRGAGIEHKTEISLTVKEKELPPEPDFEIKAEPGLQTLYRGEFVDFTVTLTAVNEFAGEVELNVTGVPAGTAASLAETTVTPTGTSRLRVTTSGDTPLGAHILTITGKGGGKEHSATIRLEVVCRDFSVEIKTSTDRGPGPLTVEFAAAITGGDEFSYADYSFSWDFNDGGTSDQQNPGHTFRAPGNYRVTVSAVDTCGQVKTTAATIAVEGFEGTIGKSFSASEALPGAEVFINIEVKNNTRFDFTGITVQDELAPVLEYLGDNSGAAPRRSGQELEWQFPRLEKNQTLSFSIKVKVSGNAAPGVINNTAFLYHGSLGPGRRITSNIASLNINRIGVSLHKQVEQTTARPGETITYRLAVKNNSSVPLTGIQLADELSHYLEFISAAGNVSLNFNRQERRLEWQGTLEAGQQEMIVLNARIAPNTFSGTLIENSAKLEAAELKEPVISETVVTAVTAGPVPTGRVRFTKRPEVPQTEIGRIIRFRLTVTNMSDSALVSPLIEDHLPRGFSYVAGTTLLNGQRFTGPRGKQRLHWQLPLIEPNETVVLRYQVVIGADARRGRNVNRAVFRAVDNSGQDILLEASAFVNVSTGSIIFYSGVAGTVYLDRDHDDFYSAGDTPLQGIEVRMSTGEKSITDVLGHYSFENLFPGEYAVGVNHAALPEKYRLSSPYPRLVVLTDGLFDTVDFAVKFKGEDEVKTARLQGRVFLDKNSDGRYDSEDPMPVEFQAVLDNRIITVGKQGVFVFSHLETGNHTVEIRYAGKSVTKEVLLKKGENFVDIALKFTGIKLIVRERQ